MLREPETLEKTALLQPGGAEKANAALSQSACHKAQHPGAGAIQPGQIIDNQQGRAVSSGLPEQGERGIADPQPVRSGALTQTEGHQQSIPVPCGKNIDLPTQGKRT